MAKEGKQNASATDNIPGLYSLHFAPRVKLDFGLGASCDVIKSSACLLRQRCELACGGRTYQPCEVIGAFTANLLARLQPCNPATLQPCKPTPPPSSIHCAVQTRIFQSFLLACLCQPAFHQQVPQLSLFFQLRSNFNNVRSASLTMLEHHHRCAAPNSAGFSLPFSLSHTPGL